MSRLLSLLVVGVALPILLTIGCTNDPAPTPTSPAPTAVAEPSTRIPLGISQDAILTAFEQAGFSAPNSHGPEWVSAMYFPGTGSGITLDVFGPEHNVETAELSFWASSPIDDALHKSAVSLACELLVLITAPEWSEGGQWVTERVASFGMHGDEDHETFTDNRVIRLHYRSERDFGLVSVEGN